jgi:hypothetical protein
MINSPLPGHSEDCVFLTPCSENAVAFSRAWHAFGDSSIPHIAIASQKVGEKQE